MRGTIARCAGAWLALAGLAVVGCGSPGGGGTVVTDTGGDLIADGGGDTAGDTGAPGDTLADGAEDTGGPGDTGADGAEDTGGPGDTGADGAEDTGGPGDTGADGAEDTGSLDDAIADTADDTGPVEDGVADTGEDTEPPGDTTADTGGDTGAVEDTLADTQADTGPVGDTAADTDGGPVAGCDPLPAGLPSGTCTVTAGDEALLFLGDLLLPGGLLEDGRLLVVGDAIACAGCDCAALPEAATATVVACPGTVISPGLINAHDHITFTQMTPAKHAGIRYDHRHEWRTGKVAGKPKLPAIQNSHPLGDAWGEMRQVLGGTTSLFGSGGEDGFLRNLDRPDKLEGLGGEPADYSTFPLGDSDGFMAVSGCSGYDFDDPFQVAQENAYVPHVAEGVGAAARNEFLCLSGLDATGVDFVEPNAAFIHGVGLNAQDVGLLAAQGTGLVWSPRSNTDLYGFTADAPLYDRFGALIALGSDWTASGSVTLLRELACAESWNDVYWDGYFDDAALVAMVTSNAAELLGFGDRVGSLVKGRVADLAIWDATAHEGYRAVLDAGPPDVVGVFRGGLPLYGDAELLGALASNADCPPLDVCGRAKRLCTPREIAITTSQLQGELGASTYGLFFCGEPPDEPSCLPFRPGEFDGVPTAGDADGDGIPDGDDLCPTVFSAVRPLDGFSQADTDGDGDGDPCDPCPVNADTTTCSSVDPTDVDDDGVTNPVDNCPGVFNPDQGDLDDDGKGDACDPCPDYWNPGGAACPSTVYDVKKGVVAQGEAAFLPGVLVTAVGDTAFFVVTDPAGPSWQGPEHAAIYAFAPTQPKPPLGARIDLTGTVSDYFGQIQLQAPSFTVVDAAAGVPAPWPVSPADVAPFGKLADGYEALLVRVLDVEVLDVTPPGQTGEVVENEFLVTGGLSVDDGLYVLDPPPVEGQIFASLTGVLRYTWDRNKLMLRGPEDVQYGAPFLVALTPADAAVYAGDLAVPTLPPVSVRLSGPALEPTFVAVASSQPDVLGVVGGGVVVPAGGIEATVLVDPLQAGGPVTLTASLGDDVATASVTVLAADAMPSVVALVPASQAIPEGTSAEITVVLDLPAPADGVAVILSVEGPPDAAALLAVPAEVVVPGGATEATFLAEAIAGAPATVTVRATLDGTSATADVTIAVPPALGLVLAEVLYDVSGEDGGYEWVKLFNASPDPVDLSGYSLGWGGESYVYGKLQLAGVVAPWSCWLVGGPSASAVNGNPLLDQPQDFSPDIQNSGSTADGVALFAVPASALSGTTVPVDCVVYGGSNSNGLLGPDGLPVPEPHAPDASANNSLRRVSVDTWQVASNPTPNACLPLQ